MLQHNENICFYFSNYKSCVPFYVRPTATKQQVKPEVEERIIILLFLWMIYKRKSNISRHSGLTRLVPILCTLLVVGFRCLSSLVLNLAPLKTFPDCCCRLFAVG